jgi:putative PEP-CTERM system TPR-repeat lipoprotein
MVTKLTSWAATFALAAAALLAGCKGSESEEKLLESARSYIAARDYKAATIQLKTLLQKNPDSAVGRALLGKSLLEVGDARGALLELRKAQELKHPADQLVPDLARAMLVTGEHVKVLAQYADTKLASGDAQADLLTSLAIAYAAQGQLDKAREMVAAALQTRPNHVGASLVSARLKAGSNDLDGALAVLDQVLAKEPGNDRAGTLRGELLWQGRQDEAGALAAFKRVLESNPQAVSAHVAIIGIHNSKGRRAEALNQFQVLKKIAPGHPETMYLEAQLALTEGNADSARDLIAQVLKVMPSNPRALLLAAAAEYQLRGYLQAEAHLTRALQSQPNNVAARHLLAQTHLRNSQPAKALDALAPLLEGGKGDGASLALAAEAHLQTGDVKRADQFFQAASKAAPTDARVRTAVALAQYARGDTQLAMNALEAIAADDKGTRADLALVSARLRANDAAGALKAIDALQKKTPSQPLPDLLRGRVLLQRKDLPAATSAFQAALKKDPKFVPAVAALASIDLASGKPDAARKRLQDHVALDPTSWQAHLALAEFVARTGGSLAEVAKLLTAAVKANPTQTAPRLAQIEQLLRLSDNTAALQAAKDARAALPNSDEILAALGRAQLAAGETQQAIGTFGQLAGKQPTEISHPLRLADAHALANDLNGARVALRKALEIDPASVPAKRALAAIALRQNRADEARQIARELQKSAPKDAAGYALEGDVERTLKNWGSAVAAYRKAFTISPETDLAIRLHQSLYAGGQRPEADRLAAEWQQSHAGDHAFRYYLGDVAMLRSDWATGEQHYRAVLAAQPRNALALNNVAWLMAKQGKPGAVKLAEQANEVLPNRPHLMDTLATALAAEGDIKRALEVQREAVMKDTKDPSLKLNLAKLYLQAKDKTRARAELEDLERLGDRFKAHAEVVDLLKLAK